MGIHRSSVSQIICKDLRLKCFKRHRAHELTDSNCAARMKHAKQLLQKFPQYMPLTLFSLRTKKCSRWLHLTIDRTKSVADCGNFWRRILAFSSVRHCAVCHCLLTVAVSATFEQLIKFNTMLCPAFLRKFVCQPLRCVPLQIQTFFIKILSSSLNIILIVDKHCSDVCGDELLKPQIDRQSKRTVTW